MILNRQKLQRRQKPRSRTGGMAEQLAGQVAQQQIYGQDPRQTLNEDQAPISMTTETERTPLIAAIRDSQNRFVRVSPQRPGAPQDPTAGTHPHGSLPTYAELIAGVKDATPKVKKPELTDEELIDKKIRELLEGVPDSSEERAAMLEQQRVSQAQNIQSQRARSGMSGTGLTGAAAAGESRTRREGARDEARGMADFDRNVRMEALQRLTIGMDSRRREEVFRMEKELYEKELAAAGAPAPAGDAPRPPPPNATPIGEGGMEHLQEYMDPSQATRQAAQPPSGGSLIGYDRQGNRYYQTADGVVMVPPQ